MGASIVFTDNRVVYKTAIMKSGGMLRSWR
jgi:hypothetical protein